MLKLNLKCSLVLCVLLALCCTLTETPAAPSAETGAAYFSDKPFPQFMYLWQEGWRLKDSEGNKLIYARPDMPLGGYAFVYYRNTGKEAVKITDLMIEGIKLSEGLGVTHKPRSLEERYGSSILLSKLPKDQIELLKSAGAPVWWKAEPQELAPGAIGEIVVRLRRDPQIEKLNIGIVTDEGVIEAVVQTSQQQPRFTTISFTPELDTVYLYASHPMCGMKPTKIFLDGKDVTQISSVVSDDSLDTAPIVIKLSKPLDWMSYHNFKAMYPDGSAAVAGIRAWGREMVYGMWGASLGRGEDEEVGRRYLTDWAEHNINVHMGMPSGAGTDFFRSDEGWEFCESIGIDRMTRWIVEGRQPAFFFLMDEPDAHDAGTDEVRATERLGSLGQHLVTWADVLRRHGPDTPILLNIDNTYKPENWYMYHQLPDIPCIDPYYPEQLDYVYRTEPGKLSAHTKPTYVYAVSAISQSSGQPKPLHAILCSTKYFDAQGYEGRFPTPEEKRMEVYYAIAAGAKGLSYWWFSPDRYCRGCGEDDPDARALWKEIGLLGAEVRTAGPIITRSCPATLEMKATPRLWVRSLLSGLDTVAIIVVNDDVACDRAGTVFKPVEQAAVTVTLPSWIKARDVLEITYDGIKDVQWKDIGSQVSLDLGSVELTRFILITSDAELRNRLQALYETDYAHNVASLTAE